MKKTGYSRREFLELSTAAAGASLASPTIGPFRRDLVLAPRAARASDRVRFGMVGVGMQGSGLLSQAVRLAGVECAGPCALYHGPPTPPPQIFPPAFPST